MTDDLDSTYNVPHSTITKADNAKQTVAIKRKMTPYSFFTQQTFGNKLKLQTLTQAEKDQAEINSIKNLFTDDPSIFED